MEFYVYFNYFAIFDINCFIITFNAFFKFISTKVKLLIINFP